MGVCLRKQKSVEGDGSTSIAGMMRKPEVRNKREFFETLFD